MGDNLPNPYEVSPVVQSSPEASINEQQIKAAVAKLHSQQNLPLGFLAGLVASLLGATLCAVITVVTKYQIGYMAVGVGFLVGYSIRSFGKGLSPIYGVIGASLALLGCLLGNILSVCSAIADAAQESFLTITLNMFTNPDFMVKAMMATFHPMDLLFYGIAVYQGYQLSFRELTENDAIEALNGS
jgi:hypothetical protein